MKHFVLDPCDKGKLPTMTNFNKLMFQALTLLGAGNFNVLSRGVKQQWSHKNERHQEEEFLAHFPRRGRVIKKRNYNVTWSLLVRIMLGYMAPTSRW